MPKKKREHLTSSQTLQSLREVVTKMNVKASACKRSFRSGIEQR